MMEVKFKVPSGKNNFGRTYKCSKCLIIGKTFSIKSDLRQHEINCKDYKF